MTKSQKMFNWCALLACVLVFSFGAVALLLSGAVIAGSYLVLGALMMLAGVAAFGCAFLSLRLMEQYV